MMRLIDADLLLAVVEPGRCNIPIPDNDGALRKYLDWDGVKHLIERATTIDAVLVVHARWVHEQRYGDSGGWVWRCTACRREAISPIISALKYCHFCGAKMDGGVEA